MASKLQITFFWNERLPLAYPLKTLFEGCSKMSFDVLAGEARISKQKLEKCKLSLCCC